MFQHDKTIVKCQSHKLTYFDHWNQKYFVVKDRLRNVYSFSSSDMVSSDDNPSLASIFMKYEVETKRYMQYGQMQMKCDVRSFWRVFSC